MTIEIKLPIKCSRVQKLKLLIDIFVDCVVYLMLPLGILTIAVSVVYSKTELSIAIGVILGCIMFTMSAIAWVAIPPFTIKYISDEVEE